MPNFPYIIDVTVYNSSNVAFAGATVTAYNETTGELIMANTVTDSNGQTLIDLANFPSGYTNGDFIQISCGGSGTKGKDLRFKAIARTDFAQIERLNVNYEI